MVIDAGNVFTSTGLQEQIKAEIAIEAMQQMSYSIFNLGNKDFVFGLDFLLKQTQQFSVPTINANIVYDDTEENITAPYKILQFGLLRVGFIGVVAKDYEHEIMSAILDNTRAVTVLDEMTILKTQIDNINKQVDVIIVIANVGLEKSITIANKVEGIDVIICSNGEEITDDYLYFNGVYIVKAGYDGKYIGNLRLTFNLLNNIANADSSMIKLDSSIPEDEDMKALLDEYHFRLEEHKDELLDLEQKDPDTGLYYTGLSTCLQCHPIQASQWNGTPHAKAFSTLENSGQDYNKECIPCHVTGYGYTGGFTISDKTPEMKDVQCEMCHGAGGEHVDTQNLTFEPISETTCLKCHTEDNSPQFDYDTYYPVIKH